jgi:hypothetical protein
MSGFSSYFRTRSRALQLFVAGAVVSTGAFFAVPGAQAAEMATCTKICAQLIQAIGDDIKEQIPLDCIQETASCTGSGFFQTADARVPVNIEASLTGETFMVRVKSGSTIFAPADQDALNIKLEPDNPYQAAQFVVGQRSADTPFANAGTSLTVTVITQRQ